MEKHTNTRLRSFNFLPILFLVLLSSCLSKEKEEVREKAEGIEKDNPLVIKSKKK